jgi:hypothetical protein
VQLSEEVTKNLGRAGQKCQRMVRASQEWDLDTLIEAKDTLAKYQEKSVDLAKKELKK